MSFEDHVDRVLFLKDKALKDCYKWQCGLKILASLRDEAIAAAARIIQVLDASNIFGPARFNESTRKIEFGIYKSFFEGKSWSDDSFETYEEYYKAFKNFETDIDLEWMQD